MMVVLMMMPNLLYLSFLTGTLLAGTTVYGWSSDLDIGFGTAGQGNINSTAVNTGTSPITVWVKTLLLP